MKEKRGIWSWLFRIASDVYRNMYRAWKTAEIRTLTKGTNRYNGKAMKIILTSDLSVGEKKELIEELKK